MKELLIPLFCIATGISVLLFKIGYNQLGLDRISITYLLKWITNPFIFTSLIIALIARFTFYAMLKYYSVSVAYLITAVSIPINLLVFYFAFEETLTFYQAIGTTLIIIGVILVGV